jgi:hypothetical protein
MTMNPRKTVAHRTSGAPTSCQRRAVPCHVSAAATAGALGILSPSPTTSLLRGSDT